MYFILSMILVLYLKDSFDTLCNETCADLETCNVDGNGIICSIEECGEPPPVVGDIIQFGNLRGRGSEILYKCNGRDEITGSYVSSTTRSECKADGEWLYQDITCMEKNAILYNYVGCFLDKRERAINEFHFYNLTMTISLCAVICHEREQKYFGLEHYRHCFCGSKMLFEVPVTNCNSPCRGDPSTICGGAWALSLYEYI